MERSGGGDAQETLRLLWRSEQPRSGRGRPPKVSLDKIVAAAMTLADQDGLDAMTMDKVAASLGVGTMTLYTHVPGKAELLDLMLDSAWQELYLESTSDNWRKQVERYAYRTVDLHTRHPWLRMVSTTRPPLGPGLLARDNYLIAALSTAGLAAIEVSAACDAIVTFVESAAAVLAEHTHAERFSGQSDADWWAARQVFWETTFDPERYSAIQETWKKGGFNRTAGEAAANAFDLGLKAILDGLAARAQPR
ncbi:TetR/AcrR family transcriptional regulator [Kibdelosporangium philippinense]|uniref:TetR/AcrR family transcriptional regulator n=1 Tax=Kibdelosporangium philippinense TaxID=211113 RepID=A0ABS8ZE80_9PSEU|nr:TetR/AcrR family transcriptional regulator [Kibdelosporangium philippinense]MCE7004818.1 TetR/AcrR family transcriptional regulator [Kibdelosporangium philippinense]